MGAYLNRNRRWRPKSKHCGAHHTTTTTSTTTTTTKATTTTLEPTTTTREPIILTESGSEDVMIENPIEYFSQQAASENKKTTDPFAQKMQGLINNMQDDSKKTENNNWIGGINISTLMEAAENFFGSSMSAGSTRTEPEISFESERQVHFQQKEDKTKVQELEHAEISTSSSNYVHIGAVESDEPKTVCRGSAPHLTIVHLNHRRRR